MAAIRKQHCPQEQLDERVHEQVRLDPAVIALVKLLARYAVDDVLRESAEQLDTTITILK